MNQNHNAADKCDTAAPAHPRGAANVLENSMLRTISQTAPKSAAPENQNIHPDAELLALGKQLRAVIDALAAADDRVSVASSRFTDETPPQPAAARIGRWDWYLFYDLFPTSRLRARIGDDYSLAELECLRSKPITFRRRRRPTAAEKAASAWSKFDRILCAPQPSWRGQRRAHEILAAYADFRVSEDKRYVACGFEAAVADLDRINTDEGNVIDRIIAAPCRTLHGLAVKAAAMERVHEAFGDPGDDYVEQRMMRALCRAVAQVAETPDDPISPAEPLAPAARAANRIKAELRESAAA
jgi:hypothetical protein